VAKKPEILHERRCVVYDSARWKNLDEIRARALEVIEKLGESGIQALAHGSVARGDVSDSSDVDLVVPYQVPSFRVELAVGQGVRREIVQATPSSVLKGHIHLDQRTVVSFPLIKMMTREMEFYRWGGIVGKSQLEQGERVAGVDKRLILIEPTREGHIESGVVGYEHAVAKRVGVSIDIARERVRVLLRRDQVGRTGVYLSRVLPDDDSFEAAIHLLRDRDPAIRRTIERRSK
jgi:predicted nucleotidyltransferase